MAFNVPEALFRETAFYHFDIFEGADVARRDPLVDRMLAHWHGIRPGSGLPTRQDLRPQAIPRLLPHLVIMDLVSGPGLNGEPFGLHVRLIGSHVTAHFGELTDRRIERMENRDAARRIYHMADRVIASRDAALSVVRGIAPGREGLMAAALYLPFSGVDGKVDKVVTMVHVHEASSPIGRAPGDFTL
ncbi:PAS domain-containing protein [Yunchengibacter salinarum]|uniref:PAS domain-containing protein n=1 Tax=Yunchengibacter salinarum TaxID=3133399 RepID=UPI0035B65A16